MRSVFGQLLIHVSFATFTLAFSAHAQVCEIVEQQTVASGVSTNDVSIGTSVAISGDYGLIGAPGIPATNGKVMVIHRPGASSPWEPTVEIGPKLASPGDRFGHSVAMDGDVAIIGAPGSASLAGAVYFFRNTNGVWIEESKFYAPDSAINDKFGTAVDIEGNWAVVGKPGSTNTPAYVFKNTAENWELAHVVTPNPAPLGSNQIGRSVAISGNRILLGASNRGIVFDFDGVNWIEGSLLLGLLLGSAESVALQGDMAITAGPGSSELVRIFEFESGGWTQTQVITSPVVSLEEEFGASIALHDGVLLIGATQHTPATVNTSYEQHGCVYNYQRFQGQWFLHHKLVCSRGATVQLFGKAVAIDGQTILAGGSLGDFNPVKGEAYAYLREPIDCNKNGIPDRCDQPDCNGNAIVDSCEVPLADCDANSVADLCEATATYVWDDDDPYTSWGNNDTLFDFLWLNQFSVLPASQVISHIDIGFARLTAEGHPIKLLIYDDPNNDGNPSDAVLVQSVDSLTHSFASLFAFSRVEVPPTYVGEVGDSFFIGAKVSLDFPGCSVALSDQTSTQGRSWRKTAPLGEMNLGTPGAVGNFLTFSQDLMVRGVSFDCNGNGTWDQCDIDSGLSADVNGNGLPDECEGSCVADLAPQKGNAVVDVDDLLFIINNWGMCEVGQPCQADVAPVGGNGQVDVDDLLFVINNWGPCL